MAGISVSVIDAAIRGAIVGGFIMLVVVLLNFTFKIFRKSTGDRGRAITARADVRQKNGGGESKASLEPGLENSIPSNIGFGHGTRISDAEIIASMGNKNKENQLETSTQSKIDMNSMRGPSPLDAALLSHKYPDFAKALSFFPDLKAEVEYLAVYGPEVQALFVEQLLECQAFQDPSSITSQLVSANLQKRFGRDPLLQVFGKELLVGRLFAAAQELEDYVRVVGNAASPIQIIDKVKQSQAKRDDLMRDRVGIVSAQQNLDISPLHQERVASAPYSLTKVFLISGLIILPILAVFELATAPVSKQSPTENRVLTLYEERAKKCSLGRVAIGDIIGFDVNNERLRARIYSVLNNLKSSSHDWLGGTLEFQNMNSFGVSQVQLGFTDLSKCPNNLDAYKFTIYCGSSETESGVGARSFGKLSCMPLPQEARGMNYCKVGFVPFYNRFRNGSFLEFMEQNGFC